MSYASIRQPPGVYHVRRSSSDMRYMYRSPSGYYPHAPEMQMIPHYAQPIAHPTMAYSSYNAYAGTGTNRLIRGYQAPCCGGTCCSCWNSCCPCDCCRDCCDCCY
ncbi:hypothetical protein K474DRAFT_487745 [Panus rudis PR-1116 ss-1]|nr:hypothetical protein K474DRAFT_487745 [Panus rudis PR-1116 ss-1]